MVCGFVDPSQRTPKRTFGAITDQNLQNEGKNYDIYAMSDIRKLRSHPTARLADLLPPADLITQFVTPSVVDGGPNHHLFWVERRPNRAFDEAGQATYRWRGLTYNVARVLLQHRARQRVVRAVNSCGLPQCVRPEHWTVEPPFLGAVATATGHATIRVGDAWRLSVGGKVIDRDVVFVATIQPGAKVRHVLRALHEDNETVFLTACGQLADPALVVASTRDASCPGCVS